MEKARDCSKQVSLSKTKRKLLESIATEETALGHLLEAQAKQLEAARQTCQKTALTESTTQLVETVLMKEWLLLRKLEHVLTIEGKHHRKESSCIFDET